MSIQTEINSQPNNRGQELDKWQSKVSPEHLISILSGVLVIMIGSLAFRLSFNAIRELAEAYGTAPELSWIVPVIVDMAVIAFSVSVLRASLMGESGAKWIGRCLIVLYTGLSVAFNIGHSTGELWAIVIAVIVPLTVLSGFETFVHQIESWVNRNGTIRTLAELSQFVADLQLTLTQLDEEITERQLTIEDLNGRIGELNLHKRILLLNETQRLLIEFLKLNPTASQIEMADYISKSRATVSGYLKELVHVGLIAKGEEGYEVIDLS